MKRSLSLLTIMFISLFANAEELKKPLPIKSGEYIFQHKFAEHPEMESIYFRVKIDGNHIVVSNSENSEVFPIGLIDDGTLIFHEQAQEWIISTSPKDENAEEVGGCSDGPTVVDLINHIYWTC